MHNLNLVQMAHAKDKRPVGDLRRHETGAFGNRLPAPRWAMEPKVLLLDEPFGRASMRLTPAPICRISVMALAIRSSANTILMITHDVDEGRALLSDDRIVMMTNGPSARIGEVLEVPLGAPRRQAARTRQPTPGYLKCRQRVARIPLRSGTASSKRA